jgi:hypothetical protein
MIMNIFLAAKRPTKERRVTFPACISYNPNENAHNSTQYPQALLDDPHCADAKHSHYSPYPQVCQPVRGYRRRGTEPAGRDEEVCPDPQPFIILIHGKCQNGFSGGVMSLEDEGTTSVTIQTTMQRHMPEDRHQCTNFVLNVSLQTVREAPRRPRRVTWI